MPRLEIRATAAWASRSSTTSIHAEIDYSKRIRRPSQSKRVSVREGKAGYRWRLQVPVDGTVRQNKRRTSTRLGTPAEVPCAWVRPHLELVLCSPYSEQNTYVYACAGWRMHVRAFARVRVRESQVPFTMDKVWMMASNYRHGTKQPSQTCGVHRTTLRVGTGEWGTIKRSCTVPDRQVIMHFV